MPGFGLGDCIHGKGSQAANDIFVLSQFLVVNMLARLPTMKIVQRELTWSEP
jgi:hypothetical protein